MPSESDLRERFHEGTQPSGAIDVDAVLRRARARRRPKVVIAGAGSMLAIAAIAVPAALGSFTSTTVGSALSADESSDTAFSQPGAAGGAGADGTEMAMDRPPAELLNLCSTPLAEISPAENGLVLTVEPVTAAAGDDGIPTIVTLTNTGDAPVSGTTAGRPALTLSQGGVTLWHTNGAQPMIAVTVELEPGESVQYPATFEPVRCAVEDDAAEGFRDDLPALEPGLYQLTAAIDFTRNDGSSIDLVTGPAARASLT